MQSETINSTTEQRHKKIFSVFEAYLLELGNQAKNISRKSIYEEVAKRSNYSQDHVRKVISLMLRGDRYGFNGRKNS